MDTIVSKSKDLLKSNRVNSIISRLCHDIQSVLLLAHTADTILDGNNFFDDSVESIDSYITAIINAVEREFNNPTRECPASDQSE